MTVLVVGPGASYSTADVDAGVVDGLERAGVTVIRYRLDERIDRSHRWLYTSWRRAKRAQPAIDRPTRADVFYHAGIGVLERALRFQVDVVLVVSAMFLHPDVLILLKRAGLRVVVLFTESPYDLPHEVKVARLVDGCWTTERTAVDAFRAVTPRAGYLPHGWHPARHTPTAAPGDADVPAHDVVLVGTAWPARVALLTAIDWTGIDLGLYGTWTAIGPRHPLRRFVRAGVVDYRVATALYRRAAVGLNLYREHPTAESLNPRAYELAACGAVTLSTARREVADVFGDLVPTFADADGASTAIRRALADPDWRAATAAALPARVASASWTDRARTIVDDIGTWLRVRAA